MFHVPSVGGGFPFSFTLSPARSKSLPQSWWCLVPESQKNGQFPIFSSAPSSLLVIFGELTHSDHQHKALCTREFQINDRRWIWCQPCTPQAALKAPLQELERGGSSSGALCTPNVGITNSLGLRTLLQGSSRMSPSQHPWGLQQNQHRGVHDSKSECQQGKKKKSGLPLSLLALVLLSHVTLPKPCKRCIHTTGNPTFPFAFFSLPLF